jgi:hypothetical protein
VIAVVLLRDVTVTMYVEPLVAWPCTLKYKWQPSFNCTCVWHAALKPVYGIVSVPVICSPGKTMRIIKARRRTHEPLRRKGREGGADAETEITGKRPRIITPNEESEVHE